MKTVIIDNYDSFTYNLAHLVKELGAEVNVLRNDKFRLEELEVYDKIILSPGPGIPEEAGLLLDVIRTYAGRKPMLGVCLGEQAIGQVFGGKLVNLSEVFHGIQTEMILNEELRTKNEELGLKTTVATDVLFKGLPDRIPVGRYHSWVVDTKDFPEALAITAISPEGQIMALRHREYDIHGIQFHPESVLTPDGKTIVGNWLFQ
ncbi:MAG: aminodeoxychorismate/anthranilate synthase component II [Bacteroides sp.]|nr:aminodeoxychorismate/anthranilate synthase component II [Bacteroides sp.]